MNPRYPLVADRAAHRCEYCRAPEVIFNFPFEVEHVVPRSEEGADDEENWALACRSCNVYKSSVIQCEDPDTGELDRLYDPRSDCWKDNFHVDGDSGHVVGNTAIGRATVACLKMNAPAHVAARQQWTKLGLFPG